MPEFDALASILSRNAYYRNGYRRLLNVALIQLFIIALLIVLLIYKFFIAAPDFRYFSTTTEGRLTPMIPVNEPSFTPEYVSGWVNNAATRVMSLDYRTYQKRLQENSVFFTPEGWNTFMAQLQGPSQLLKSLVERQWIITATPLEAPKITRQGVINGVYTWEVQMPVALRFEGKTNYTENRLLTLRIARVSLIRQPSGLGIVQWIESQWSPAKQ